MFFFSLILIITSSFHASAEVGVVYEASNRFIKLEDSRVIFLTNNTKTLAPWFSRGTVINFEINENHDILKISAAMPEMLISENAPKSLPRPKGLTFVYGSYSKAQKALDSFRFPDAVGSQCYDRAHIWVYEAEIFSSASLNKMWLFFSDHYIEANKFKWWFHVAPIAKVSMKGSVESRIMDRSFAQFPLRLKLWTDLFMIQKQDCKQVTLYTDYSEHPNEDDCYLIESNPYFWQPRDLEKFAKKSVLRSRFIEDEISHAYQAGFGITQ